MKKQKKTFSEYWNSWNLSVCVYNVESPNSKTLIPTADEANQVNTGPPLYLYYLNTREAQTQDL